MDAEKNHATETEDSIVNDGKFRRSLRRRSGLFENFQFLPDNKEAIETAQTTITTGTKPPTPPTLKDSKKINNKTVEKIYLNTSVKRLPSTLETIFEDPITKKDESVALFSTRKQSRVLCANSSTAKDKTKIKKRKTRIKKYLPHVKFVSRKRVSKEVLIESLKQVESSSEEKND